MTEQNLKTKPSNSTKPVLCEVYLSEIAPYNETDCALNGGFFNCPECGEQQYVSKSEQDDEYICDCGVNIVFK